MEIINLKSPDVSLDRNQKKFQITDIKQAVKNENRVNVFVDGKYSFSLGIAQLVDFKLKIGTTLSDQDIEKYQKASTFGKEYQKALEWVLTRPHSVREAREHLSNRIYKKATQNFVAGQRRAGNDSTWGHPQSLRGRSAEPRKDGREARPQGESCQLSAIEQGQIIERLIEKGYLDDEKFAKYYLENRFTKKGISKKRLKLELIKKGVSNEIIERVMSENDRTDEEEIKKIIAKKRNKYDDEKLISYLARQGFDFELARNLVQDSSETD